MGTSQVFWTIWTDRSDLLYKTGQIGLEKFVKLSIGLHHCVDLVETIEMHIWNVQFGVQMRKLCRSEDLHPGRTGPGAVRPVRNAQTELGVVF